MFTNDKGPTARGEIEVIRILLSCKFHLSLLAACLSLQAVAEPAKSKYLCKSLFEGKSKQLAVTLAGGGTKASSFSMGVLAALASQEMPHSAAPDRVSNLALWQTDLISTVSGGSYAGYFLYSRLIDLYKTPQDSPALHNHLAKTVKNYFADCIPASLQPSFPETIKSQEAKRRGVDQASLFCPLHANVVQDEDKQELIGAARQYWTAHPEQLHQQFHRCHRDILSVGPCNFENTGEERFEDCAHNANSVLSQLALTLGSVPLSWAINVFWDWPLNLSPTRMAYRDGIGLVFGARPSTPDAFNRPLDWANSIGAVEGVKSSDGRLLPMPLSFADLKTLKMFEAPSPPRWTINATAAPSRHILGWIGQNNVDMDKHIFRMSDIEQCAGEYGAIKLDGKEQWPLSALDENFSPLLTAVNASAAFLDANEDVYEQPWRFIFGVLQQAFNLNWGIDLRNINQDSEKRAPGREWIHNVIPFFYTAESGFAEFTGRDPVFIRLVDGGSSDNLGAYGPIVEGVKDILISDHAQDDRGTMGDLCFLRNELFIRRDLHLHIPGLKEWPRGCLTKKILGRSLDPAKGKIPEDDFRETSSISYPVWAWPYPFLTGCVSSSPDPEKCLNDPRTRVWIIKPAFDYPYWLETQVDVGNISAQEANLNHSTSQLSLPKIRQCGANHQLPCEASAVMLWRTQYSKRTSIFDTSEFPQGGTVRMTYDSSSNEYGAYRELANHYTRQVIAAIDNGLFINVFKWQQKHPIVGAIIHETPDLNNLKYLPAWGDIKLDLWDNHVRNLARRGVVCGYGNNVFGADCKGKEN